MKASGSAEELAIATSDRNIRSQHLVSDYNAEIVPAQNIAEIRQRLHAGADTRREARRLKRLVADEEAMSMELPGLWSEARLETGREAVELDACW